MNRKRFTALFLAFAMLLSTCMPIGVFAESTKPTITVQSVKDLAGATVTVNVTVTNNPGILGATLTVDFDDALSLVSASSGEAFSTLTMTKPGDLQPPCNFVWDGQELSDSDIKDGIILSLEFKIPENAEPDTSYPITFSYIDGDILNAGMQPIDVSIVNGEISVVDFTYGDLNDDNKVNFTDVILLRREIAGKYVQTINKKAADVNCDNRLNTADVILMRRFIVGGYDITFPLLPLCVHDLLKVEAQAPTGTEDGNIAYWTCQKCGKYFADANASKEISLLDTVIKATGNAIEYDLNKGNTDIYLVNQNIDNPNPDYYSSETGLILKDLYADGYQFLGWYTEPLGGTRVTEIKAGETGNKKLYAHWEKAVYKITFDSPDVPWAAQTYTVDEGATLTNPSWFGYTFVGWSNDDGFLVTEIKPGTTGNITLHANWTSDRNKAVSYSNYGKPIIIEDNNKGQFLFVYNIGRIENVPLSEIEYIGKTQTLSIDKEYKVTDSVTAEDAKTIAQTVARATTESSGWTLSKDWEQIYEAGEEYADKQVKSEERTDSQGNVVGGKYFVSNSNSGSTYVSSESGGSSAVSAKITTANSVGINQSYDKQTSSDTYVASKLGVTNTTEASAGVKFPVKVIDVSAGIKNTTTVSAEVEANRRDTVNEAYHVDGQKSSFIGTNFEQNNSSYFSNTVNKSNSWNSSNGYEQSKETSNETSVTDAISNEIAKTNKYNLSKALSEGSTENNTVSYTNSTNDEASATVRFVSDKSQTETKHITFNSDRPGYYRLVMAGTIHIYGVVGYDVATSSYFTYTFNVQDDATREYLDYSKDNSLFDDCENGVVDFEIPYEVNEYITAVTGDTVAAGLEVHNNVVTDFEAPDDFDGTVVIPQYYSVNNLDKTYSAYKTKSFAATTFKGNTSIKTVVLPIYVTEIPDGAFEGCTNLESIIAFGVTRIGANAFKGCTSLKAFAIDNKVTALGENAFEGVPEIDVMAANAAVADAAIQSGAERITVNLSHLSDVYSDKTIVVDENTDYFGLIGNGSTYSNVSVKSDAAETFISNMTFANSHKTPLEFSSPKVTLARVTVEKAPGFALILKADTTDVGLFDTIELNSDAANVAISKNVNLSKANTGAFGKLKVNGTYLICGEVGNQKMLDANELVSIEKDAYETYLKSFVITFDANKGEVSQTTKVASFNVKIGELPVPIRAGYGFVGWFTERDGGTPITADTVIESTANMTLYAHWEANAYTLSYNANGGSGAPDSQTKYHDTDLTISTVVPTKIGHTFTGWLASENGKTYQPGENLSENRPLTLTAQWTPNKYTVYFDGNGGSLSYSSKTVTYSKTYGDFPSVSRTGFTFAGWYTSDGYAVSSGSTVSITANQTLTARWNANTYTVYFNGNGGTPSYGSKNVVFTGTYGDLPSASRTGYSFTGWYTSDGTRVSSGTPYSTAGDVTLYAYWSANSYTYNVYYRSVNGTDLGSTTVTSTFGSTKTVYPIDVAGYTKPSAQNVIWDYAGAKSVVLSYSPIQVSFTTVSGQHYSTPVTTHKATAEYRNRTATTVQMRITWTDTIAWDGYNYNSQRITATIGSVKSSEVIVVPWGAWSENNKEVASTRSKTASTEWVTVSVQPNTTSVSVSVYHRQTNQPGTTLNSAFTKNFDAAIPKY